MERVEPDETLDLIDVACPQNSARVLLKLEGMPPDSILEVILDDGESISNVSASIKQEGYKIIHKERLGDKWRLIVRKI